MKTNKYTLLASCLLATSFVMTGCDEETTPPEPETDTVKITLMHKGQPAVGVQVIMQDQATGEEIGSAVTGATGEITSDEIDADSKVVVTLVGGSAGSSTLLSVRDIKAGADLDLEYPFAATGDAGTLRFAVPADFPGATSYRFVALDDVGGSGTYLFTPLLTGTDQDITVSKASVLPNGKVHFAALAMDAAYKVIAYTVAKNASFTPVGGGTPTAITVPAWTAFSPGSDVSLKIAFSNSTGDGTLLGAYAELDHFSQGAYLGVGAHNTPASFATSPLTYGMHVIPGLAEEFVLSASAQFDGGMTRANVRRAQALAANLTWNASTGAIKSMSGLAVDPASAAGAPKLTWANAASQKTSADFGIASIGWTVGTDYFNWIVIASPESFETTGTAGQAVYPALPAAYAGFVPAPGTVFDSQIALYGKYSELNGYEAFLEQENLRAATLKPSQGSLEIGALTL